MKGLAGSLACVLYLAIFDVHAVPVVEPVSIGLYRENIQATLSKSYPAIEQALVTKVNQSIADNALLYNKYGIYARIVSWDSPVLSHFDSAPGVFAASDGGLIFRVPASGGYSISVPNIRVSVAFLWWNYNTEVNFSLSNIHLQFGFRITATDGGKLNIDHSSAPKIAVSGVVHGPSTGFSTVDNALSDLVNNKIANYINQSDYRIYPSIFAYLQNGTEYSSLDLNQQLAKLETDTLMPIGGGIAADYPITPYSPDLEATVLNIDAKIIEKNMGNHYDSVCDCDVPNGIVYEVYSDTDSDSSWQLAFSPLGSGSPGSHTAPITTDDAAIWTGTYLAAASFRYHVQRYQSNQKHDSLILVDTLLSGIEKLFQVYGNTGRLARFAVAENPNIDCGIPEHPYAVYCQILDEYKNDPTLVHRNIDGLDWIGHQNRGISRDQYIGVLLGLNSAYDLVDDPLNSHNIRERARNLIVMAVGYLVRNNWIIDEGRDPTSVLSWATVPHHQIAFLTFANHVTKNDNDGAKFETELSEAYKLLNMAWFSSAMAALDPVNKYYKHNLFRSTMFSYLSIDHDFYRRDKMMEGIRISDFYIGHHTNAYFNLVRVSYDNKNRKAYLDQALEVLKLRLQGGHRYYIPSDTLSMKRDSLSYQAWINPIDGALLQLTRYPVHPALRDYGEFVWQRSPYVAVAKNSFPGDMVKSPQKKEQIGVDISLVYWMLRAQGYAANPALDDDNDGIPNQNDNCVVMQNVDQLDNDHDGLGDLCDNDDDNDGLTDLEEAGLSTNPMLADTDNDQLPDICEARYGLDPTQADSDNNGVMDAVDDQDADRLPNNWECEYGFSLSDPSNASMDSDSDGLNNLLEYTLGTSAINPDSDGDGIDDGTEVLQGTNPLLPNIS